MIAPSVLAQSTGGFWMPERASTVAGEVDFGFYLVLGISVFFFFLIVTLMIYFAIRYRHREGREHGERKTHHSTPLELAWTSVPVALVVLIFFVGFNGFLNMYTPPSDAYEVLVTGVKWQWLFEYPETGTVVANELHVPANTPIRLVLKSEDVIHSFFVPAFRVKRDVVPGRYNKIWFEATEPGEYDLFCAEYCGTQHSGMIAKVIVHDPDEFRVWLEEASRSPLEDLTPEQFELWKSSPEQFAQQFPELAETIMPPAQVGEQLYTRQGCNQCHTLDGTTLIGPSFQGLFGRQIPLQDGQTVVADENYIRNSILNPNEQIHAGFDPVMPTYQGRLQEREVTAIIEYIKSLSQ